MAINPTSIRLATSTTELERYAAQLVVWLQQYPNLLNSNSWSDQVVRMDIPDGFPMAPKAPLSFIGLPQTVINELKCFWINALTDKRKRSPDWFYVRFQVQQWLCTCWEKVSSSFNVNIIADIPAQFLHPPTNKPYLSIGRGAKVGNNNELMQMYADWVSAQSSREIYQVVRSVRKDEGIVERQYWKGNIAVAGDIHRDIVVFREQLKPPQSRCLVYIKDLYSEENVRFIDRQKRTDTLLNYYKYPEWMREAVRLHIMDKINHGELGPKTLVAYFGRFIHLRDFLYERFESPTPAVLTPVLIEDDFVAWGNRKKLVGKNWFTDTVQLIKAAARLLPAQWPTIQIQARAVRKVERKQSTESKGRLYASKEGASRAIPPSVVSQISQWIYALPAPIPTIFLLAVCTGARAEDLHALLFDCLSEDPHDERFMLLTFWQSKVSQWNTKPLLKSDESHARVIRAIEDQRAAIKKMHQKETKYLFPLFHGEKESWLSFGYSARLIKQLCFEQDILGEDGKPYNFTWHPIRHHRGTEMASQGHDIMTIMMELGHASPDMATTYVNRRLELKKNALLNKGGGKFYTIEGFVDEKLGDLLVRKEQSVATRVCGGACTLPGQLGDWCQHAHACLSCKHFRADGRDLEFFKSEKALLLDITEQQENEAREQSECGRQRMAELVRVRQIRNREALQNVDNIISAIESESVYRGKNENLLKTQKRS